MKRSVQPFAIAALLCMPTLAVAQPAINVELPFRTKYLFAGIPFAAEQVQQVQA